MIFKLKLRESIGMIKLGMSKVDVIRSIQDKPIQQENYYYFFNNHLQIEFENNKVVFIQLCNDPEINLHFNGINIFQLRDIEIMSLFSKNFEVDKTDNEFGYVYSFPKGQICFWRSENPEILKSELTSLDKQAIDYKEEQEFYISEIEKFSYFETISIFEKDYYND